MAVLASQGSGQEQPGRPSGERVLGTLNERKHKFAFLFWTSVTKHIFHRHCWTSLIAPPSTAPQNYDVFCEFATHACRQRTSWQIESNPSWYLRECKQKRLTFEGKLRMFTGIHCHHNGSEALFAAWETAASSQWGRSLFLSSCSHRLGFFFLGRHLALSLQNCLNLQQRE